MPLPKTPDRRGNFIVKYEVKYPKALSSSQKDAIRFAMGFVI
jgi:DnaJ-class molecular chaperone